jgi:hypothetical protein
VCDDNGNFDAAASTSDFECTTNTFVESSSVINGVPNADYSSCTSSTAENPCEPVCLPGFKTSGANAGFTFVCDDNNDCRVSETTGNLECSINTCSGNARDGVANADYSSCGFAQTSTTCIPVCPIGFSTTGSSNGVSLVCEDNGDYSAADTGDLECTINTFSESSSVSNGVPNADYSSCESNSASSSCVAKCLPGFTTTGASSSFNLICDNNGVCDAGADTGDLECTLNICSGQVWNGNHLTRADYSSCAVQSTGGICIPICPSGYLTTGATVGFALLCRDNGDYDAASDPGTLRCMRNTCSGMVSNGGIGVDYDSCASEETGGTCTPTCLLGYATKGVPARLPLVCDDSGAYSAATTVDTLTCSINTCSGNVINGVVHTDYSSCSTKTTGEICTPRCHVGYTATEESAGFSLVCGNTGDYSGANTSFLTCSINSFSEGESVRNEVTDADYSSCIASNSTCKPACPLGYKKTGTAVAFSLVCGDRDCVAVGDPGSMKCSINKCTGQAVNALANGDYSSCSPKTTGDTCTPMCPTGYTSTGSSDVVSLVCDENGDLDVGPWNSGDLECTAVASGNCFQYRGSRVTSQAPSCNNTKQPDNARSQRAT